MKKGSHQKKIHVNLSETLHKRLRIKCACEDISIQECVEGLIREDLAEYSALGYLPSVQTKGKDKSKTRGKAKSRGE